MFTTSFEKVWESPSSNRYRCNYINSCFCLEMKHLQTSHVSVSCYELAFPFLYLRYRKTMSRQMEANHLGDISFTARLRAQAALKSKPIISQPGNLFQLPCKIRLYWNCCRRHTKSQTHTSIHILYIYI